MASSAPKSAWKRTSGKPTSSRKWKFYQVTFQDHTGNPAIMSWGAEQSQRVPPLASWVLYLVNPETPRDFNATSFKLTRENSRDIYLSGGFRYEFFFLPGATPDQCVAHYLGEISARGTMWRQVRHVRMAMKERENEDKDRANSSAEELSSDGNNDEHNDEPQPSITDTQGLPGLPWPKHKRDWSLTSYRQWLFMYLDKDLDIQYGPDQDYDVCLVKFNPMPVECKEGQVVRWDPMEHPIYPEYIKLGTKMHHGEDLLSWMLDRSRDYWARQACDTTDHARELDWTTW